MNVTVSGCKTSVEVWDLIVFHLEIKFQTLNFVHVGKLKNIIFLKKWAGVGKKFISRNNSDGSLLNQVSGMLFSCCLRLEFFSPKFETICEVW